jgi:hypothetical protein
MATNQVYAFPHKIISLVNKQLLSLNAGLSLFDVLRYTEKKIQINIQSEHGFVHHFFSQL